MNVKMQRNTKTQMASRRLMLLLLTLFLFSQTNSSAPVDLADKKGKDDGMDLYDNSRYGDNSIALGSIISSARAGGGGSGGSRAGSGSGRSGGSGAGSGSGSGSGGSSSRRTPGGAAVIPGAGAAGAGAANNNNGHNSSGNRLDGSIGVITALSASILLLSVFTVYLV